MQSRPLFRCKIGRGIYIEHFYSFSKDRRNPLFYAIPSSKWDERRAQKLHFSPERTRNAGESALGSDSDAQARCFVKPKCSECRRERPFPVYFRYIFARRPIFYFLVFSR